MTQHYKMYLGGNWVDSSKTICIRSPFDDAVAGTAAEATSEDFVKAIDFAEEAFAKTRELPAYVRERICRSIAEGLQERLDEFSQMMTAELGKAIKDSRLEVQRAVGVFRTSAEEAKRVGGEIVDLDWQAGSEGRLGLVRRFPRGVIAGITPFNFPLNLVAHKIGPAIAAGCPMVLKPASKTPLIALMLAEILDQTEYPKGAISILPASAKNALPLLTDERIRLLTFTGSAEIGWWIKAQSGKKPVVLELGGNAGVVIADDADLEFATTRLLFGAFGVAGQSCISVQRIFVDETIREKFLTMFVEKVKKLKVGNPHDESTDIGALVDADAVTRTLAWVGEAVRNGARVVCGGSAEGRIFQPTVLTDVRPEMSVCSKEVFAPLVVVDSYSGFREAIAKLNNSDFGLQAGIFTNRLNDVFYAFRHVEAGGVIINDVPTYRVDHMPYGGVKNSGLGREGIRYAIEDMTEQKLLVLGVRS